MPPIRDGPLNNLAEHEGRVLLAISDLKNGKIPNIRHAATACKIPCANGLKLSEFEEKSLAKWILDHVRGWTQLCSIGWHLCIRRNRWRRESTKALAEEKREVGKKHVIGAEPMTDL